MTRDENERALEAAALLRRAARILGDLHPKGVANLRTLAERLQNEACGFSGPAVPYDQPSAKQEGETPPFAE